MLTALTCGLPLLAVAALLPLYIAWCALLRWCWPLRKWLRL